MSVLWTTLLRCVQLWHTCWLYLAWLSEPAFAVLREGSQRESAYNALITSQSQLERTPKNDTMQEKLNHYIHASRMALIPCNCQCAVLETHDQSMAGMKEYGWLLFYDSDIP